VKSKQFLTYTILALLACLFETAPGRAQTPINCTHMEGNLQNPPTTFTDANGVILSQANTYNVLCSAGMGGPLIQPSQQVVTVQASGQDCLTVACTVSDGTSVEGACDPQFETTQEPAGTPFFTSGVSNTFTAFAIDEVVAGPVNTNTNHSSFSCTSTGGQTVSSTCPETSCALVSIAVTPADQTLPAGEGKTIQYAATGTYSDGETKDITKTRTPTTTDPFGNPPQAGNTTTWSSSNTDVATITNNTTTVPLSYGVASTVFAGVANIIATSGTISGSTTLTVSVTSGGSGPSPNDGCNPVGDGGRNPVQSTGEDGSCSPILPDVSGQGFFLTSATNGVQFDISGTGKLVQTGWTAQGADNAFLALPGPDRLVHNGKQLFGNFTPQPSSDHPNGFAALAVYDLPANGGNGDGVIDSRDKIFSSLRLWIDTNHDGICQPDELHTLPSLGVNSISLEYALSRKEDQYGNVFRYRGRVNPEDQDGSSVDRKAYDVFFVTLGQPAP